MPLTARVRTRDGWPVAHAVVTLTDAAGRQVLRVEADAEGAVHDPAALAPGAYTVIVTAVGHAPAAAGALVTDEAAGVQAGTVTLARQGGAELPPPGPWTGGPAAAGTVDGRPGALHRGRGRPAPGLLQRARPLHRLLRPVRGGGGRRHRLPGGGGDPGRVDRHGQRRTRHPPAVGGLPGRRPAPL